ncbi:MAG: hypothetical protein ABIC91_01260 [Nanoarchaeota archaeon]|nr:hypothetical protein [Nanoarchaeota archaeon]MBU1029833.1 hypothetical protein [Nanoarchaeota archaeon]MBU1849499.1 hypothetical protein [Nanoarchaeota archaeon]
MISYKLYEYLTGIETKALFNIPNDDLKFLKEKEFINIISKQEHDNLYKKTELLRIKKQNLAEISNDLERKRLLLKTVSKPKKIFSTRNQKMIASEDQKIALSTQDSINLLESEAERLDSIISTFEKEQGVLSKFCRAKDCYVGLTEKAVKFLPFLEKFSDKSADFNFVDDYFVNIFEVVEKRYTRFIDTLKLLSEQEYDTSKDEVVSFAMSLSSCKGALELIIERAQHIDWFLKEKGFNNQNLKIVSAIVPINKGIYLLEQELNETYGFGMNQGWNNNYDTLIELAHAMRINDTPNNRFLKLDLMTHAMQYHGWSRSKHTDCCVAAYLTRMNNDYVNTAEKLKAYYDNQILVADLNNSSSNLISAFLLMDINESKGHSLSDYKQHFFEFSDIHWTKESDSVPLAGLTRIKLTIPEKRILVDYIHDKFVKEKLHDVLKDKLNMHIVMLLDSAMNYINKTVKTIYSDEPKKDFFGFSHQMYYSLID